MDVNKFLQHVKNTVANNLPGYGVGQALRGAIQLPQEQSAQRKLDESQTKNIAQQLQEITFLKGQGIKPSPQRYKEVQNQYQTMADRQMRFAGDIQEVRGQGLTSAGLALALLTAPQLGPVAIEATKKFLGPPAKAMYTTNEYYPSTVLQALQSLGLK